MVKTKVIFGIGKKIFLLLIVFSIIPLLITSTLTFNITKNTIKNLVSIQMGNVLREKKDALIEIITRKQKEMENFIVGNKYLFSLLQTLQDPDGFIFELEDAFIALNNYIIEKAKENRDYIGMLILDKHGKVIASTYKGELGLDKSDTPYFKLGSKVTAGGEIFFHNELHRVTMPLAGPIRDEHKNFIGVLVVYLNLEDTIYKILDSKDALGETGEILLFNKDGVLLNSLGGNQELVLKLKLTDDNMKDLKSSGKGVMAERKNYKKKNVLSIYDELEVPPWLLVVNQDSLEAFKSVQLLQRNFFYLGLVVLLITILISVIASKRFTKPIEELVSAARNVGKGDLEKKVNVNSNDEIGILANTFNEMAVKLKESYTNLEDKIQERTLQLSNAYDELEESEKRYKNIFENVPIGILTINKDGIIERLNPYYEKRLKDIVRGIDSIGANFYLSQFVTESILQDYIYRLLNKVEPFEIDRIRIKSMSMNKKEESYLHIKGVPMLDSFGEVERAVILIEDITEEVILEEKNKQHLIELEQSKRLASLGEMAGRVAHEVRNPLAKIRLGIDYLREEYKDVGDENRNKIFNSIISGINSLDVIIKELLDYTKPAKLKLRKRNINEILEKTLTGLEKKFMEQKIIVKQTFNTEIGICLVDEVKLQEVFVNLFSNAIDAMNGGGELCIQTDLIGDARESYIKVAIADNGCGIDEAHLEDIFNPFFTTKDHGTGLGLPIVKKIIEEHKGKIEVSSKKKEGTRFSLYIPYRQEVIDDKEG